MYLREREVGRRRAAVLDRFANRFRGCRSCKRNGRVALDRISAVEGIRGDVERAGVRLTRRTLYVH